MSSDAQFKDGVLRLAIKAEESSNALDLETIAGMRSALSLARSRPELRLVIVESALNRVFSLGMNLARLEEIKDVRVWAGFELIAEYVELLIDIATAPVPTLSIVDGIAAAGGVELACVCDTVIGTSNATFSIAQLRKGIFPFVSSAVLVPKIGHARVMHWALSGQTYSAKRLFDLGLINQLCEPEDRDRTVSLFSERVLSFDPHTLKAGVTSLRTESDMAQRIRRAHALFTLNCLARLEEGEAP